MKTNATYRRDGSCIEGLELNSPKSNLRQASPLTGCLGRGSHEFTAENNSAVSPRNTLRCCWLLNDLRNDIPNERASECPASLVAFLALSPSPSLGVGGEPPRYLNFPKRRRWLNISPPDMNSSTMYRLVLSCCRGGDVEKEGERRNGDELTWTAQRSHKCVSAGKRRQLEGNYRVNWGEIFHHRNTGDGRNMIHKSVGLNCKLCLPHEGIVKRYKSCL